MVKFIVFTTLVCIGIMCGGIYLDSEYVYLAGFLGLFAVLVKVIATPAQAFDGRKPAPEDLAAENAGLGSADMKRR